MKKQNEVRFIVTSVVSIPVYKLASKTEAYKLAAKPGWGTVDWDEDGKALVCDEDCSADLYTKNGGYFGICSYEEISRKDIPQQAACAAILTSDSCGNCFWAEDYSMIHIFVTYEESGLVDTFRIEYGADVKPYDGEVEISFEDLYERAEDDWRDSYRAELPGTIEYQHKQEAAAVAEEAGATWMDEAQREDFRRICSMIDSIKSGRDFYRVMGLINAGSYSVDVINAAREFKQCFNSAQYDPQQEEPEAAAGQQAGISLAYMDDLGVTRCGDCGAELLCSGTGDMPDTCPHCGKKLEYDFFTEPDGPDADRYRTHTTTQNEAGTAAEAASEGRETALGTPDKMAGTDTTATTDGQQAAPQGPQGATDSLAAVERDNGRQPGGP